MIQTIGVASETYDSVKSRVASLKKTVAFGFADPRVEHVTVGDTSFAWIAGPDDHRTHSWADIVRHGHEMGLILLPW